MRSLKKNPIGVSRETFPIELIGFEMVFVGRSEGDVSFSVIPKQSFG
jgi:hypothetical protein